MSRPASLSETQLRLLCDIAKRAAGEVMAVYGSAIESWRKEDDSPLTKADLRSDAVIRQGLSDAFPGVFILSEESTSAASTDVDQFFLVDPLDGTKEFIARNGEFTVNIALIRQGEPVAGVVLAPALGELFFAGRGLGAWEERADGVRRVQVAPRGMGEALRVIGSRSHGKDALAAWLAKLPCTYQFAAVGSSLKFCRIAQGQADIYPRMGPTCQWDTAAGHAVLQEAGGAVLGADGRPLRYGLDRPTINPDFAAVADAHLQFPAWVPVR